MCQRDWICLVNIFQAVRQCSIPHWLNQPCSDSLDQDLKRNWLYKQSSFAAKICLFFVEISHLFFWTWAALLGTENKALCLCCKQRMKWNVNHKLSLMTSTCILIRTVSISYAGKRKQRGTKGRECLRGRPVIHTAVIVEQLSALTRQTQRWVARNQLL